MVRGTRGLNEQRNAEDAFTGLPVIDTLVVIFQTFLNSEKNQSGLESFNSIFLTQDRRQNAENCPSLGKCCNPLVRKCFRAFIKSYYSGVNMIFMKRKLFDLLDFS